MAASSRMHLSERVAKSILNLIDTRNLHPGDILPSESDLMAQLDVGRSSVREALHGLAVLGLIEIRQGQGTFVRSLVPLSGPQAGVGDAVSRVLARGVTEELLEAREVIEVRIASMAAQRANLDDLVELERLVDLARTNHEHGQRNSYISADFHLAVAHAAHNDVLEGFVASYIPLLSERAAVLESLPGYTEWEIREHDEIRRAIGQHNARLAASRMRSHLEDMMVHYRHVDATGLRLPGPPRRTRAHVSAVLESSNV